VQRVPTDPELRQALHRLALETSGYGYRRMTRQLCREGIVVNAKKIRRLMREEHLLYSPKRRFVVTTDSDHDGLIYANLAKNLKVTQVDRLWVADLTYVRLPSGFCYLAAVVDAYSRRCIGWAIESYLDARLPLAALEMAITTRCVTPELVHHSDRGTQYASIDYTERLKKAGIQISMSRKGNPYDNAKAESFFKTVKNEEVYVNDYRTLKEARANLSHFLEAVYNQKRLHSSLDYLPPVEFEELAARQKQQQPIAVS
jgi:putative transposase